MCSQIIGGKVERLIDLVVEGSLDQAPFLRCFPLFVDPIDLFELLTKRCEPFTIVFTYIGV